MMRVGMEAEANHDHILTSDYASLLAMEFNRNPVINDEAAFDIYSPAPHADPSTLPARPPVVTIMGHVDHGKTTLLDTLRSTSVAKGEAGGITQHIGAFSVPVPASGTKSEATRTITFLDTPGHAAFSAMRARGASVTDIVVLVVAADDGIMPQTREVLELVKKSTVGLVVAINKVDKPGVDITKVEHALLAEGVQLETFGGDIPSVQVSGLTGQGLDQLVETLSALAEMQDLRAEREGLLQGYVLESKVTKGLGPTSTVLVLRGNLKAGQHLICGSTSAKVRLLHDSNGKPVKIAHPGMAVTVSGWKELPNAGDEVLTGSEADIKKALGNRARKAEMEVALADVEAINGQRRLEREKREADEGEGSEDRSAMQAQAAGPKELRLVIKGDVSGSVEAVSNALEVIGNDIARTKIVATGVGDVSESDIMRAKATEGIVIAFSVKVPRPVEAEAHSQHVSILTSSVIYKLMDDVTARVIELLPPIIEKRVTGEAAVLQLFDIHLKGKKITQIGGCRVTTGIVEKSKLARVVRDGEVVHEGSLDTLKQHKKDMTEVGRGSECGLNLAGFNDLRMGDIIQMYEEVQLPGKL
ncbi:initiation factor 2 [Fomes fomentarius]|nr:initiation factor 2 [Fomes fomentarius]